jgi:WD40 repeat protein
VDVLKVPLGLTEAERLAVLPDGDTCVVGCETSGELYVASLRAGEVLRVLQAHHSDVTGLSTASDGRLLSSASHDQTVRVWDTDTWSPSMALEHIKDGGWALASAGTVAVTATRYVGAAQVWDLARGECRGVLASGGDGLFDVAVSPDGRWAATLNPYDGVFVWDLGDDPMLDVESFRNLANDYDIEEPIQLGRQVADSHPGSITAVRFDAQGLLYTLGNAAISWDPATGARVAQLQGSGTLIDALALHPSLPVAAIAESHTLRLYRTDGTELTSWADVSEDGEPTADLAFTHDGRLISLDLAGTLRAWPAGADVG